MAIYINNKQIALDNQEIEAKLTDALVPYQSKQIRFDDEDMLLTTALQRVNERAAGKASIVVADTLPNPTVINTQYWVKTYDGQTKESGRFIILTDNLNVATYIGESEVDLSDYFKIENIKTDLGSDYYFGWIKDNTKKYTKSKADGEVDVYTITFSSGFVTAITKEETKGTIASGVLTFDSVEYDISVNDDGFYVVKDNEKAVGVSSLSDIMEKAGRVNDVKFGNKSIVNNKVAALNKIDNLEDNFYYSFKNGSNYIYIKTKAVGTNKDTYTFTYTDNVLTKITLSDKKSEIKVENGYLVAVHNGTTYSYDTTKDNYYVIDPTDKTSSIQASVMEKDLSRCFEGFYETPQNNNWKYVGYLGGSSGSTLTVNDDWSELLFVARLQENSAYYNDGKIIPKVVFTVGSPTNNNVFVGFYWNDNYTYKSRIGLYGSGTNRYIKNDYPRSDMWTIQGFYIYKR